MWGAAFARAPGERGVQPRAVHAERHRIPAHIDRRAGTYTAERDHDDKNHFRAIVKIEQPNSITTDEGHYLHWQIQGGPGGFHPPRDFRVPTANQQPEAAPRPWRGSFEPPPPSIPTRN